MSKFLVVWPSGLTTLEHSERTDVEGYAMERWGANAVKDVEAHGVKIELVTDAMVKEAGSLENLLTSRNPAPAPKGATQKSAKKVPAKSEGEQKPQGEQKSEGEQSEGAKQPEGGAATETK